MRVKSLLFCAAVIGATAIAGNASATQLVYAPLNPTFAGGNPLNGSYLLGTAQSQGKGLQNKNGASPDLSGLDQALQNLSTGLGNINVSPSVGAPIIIVNPISTSP